MAFAVALAIPVTIAIAAVAIAAAAAVAASPLSSVACVLWWCVLVPFQVGCFAQMLRAGWSYQEAKNAAFRHFPAALSEFADRDAVFALREWGASPNDTPRSDCPRVGPFARDRGPFYPPFLMLDSPGAAPDLGNHGVSPSPAGDHVLIDAAIASLAERRVSALSGDSPAPAPGDSGASPAAESSKVRSVSCPAKDCLDVTAAAGLEPHPLQLMSNTRIGQQARELAADLFQTNKTEWRHVAKTRWSQPSGQQQAQQQQQLRSRRSPSRRHQHDGTAASSHEEWPHMSSIRDSLPAGPADIAAQRGRAGGPSGPPAHNDGGTWQKRSGAAPGAPGAPGASPVAKPSPVNASHGASGASPSFPPRTQGASPAAHAASGASPSVPPRAQQTGAAPRVPARSQQKSASGASPSFQPRAQGGSPADSGPPARPQRDRDGAVRAKAGLGMIRSFRRAQRSANHNQARDAGTLPVRVPGPAIIGNACPAHACQQRQQFSNKCKRNPKLCGSCCKEGSAPCPCGDWSVVDNMCHKC